MNFELHDFNDLVASQQQGIAEYISAFTNGELGEVPQMLAKTPEDIRAKHVGIVALSADKFVGYIGASTPEEHNGRIVSEVGSLWVPMEFRKQGIARALVQTVTNKLVEFNELPYAFCNPLSLPIFTKAGYKKVACEEIPPAAFSLCFDCPKKRTIVNGCCDAMVIFGGEKL